jgi:hypothetical protein
MKKIILLFLCSTFFPFMIIGNAFGVSMIPKSYGTYSGNTDDISDIINNITQIERFLFSNNNFQ